MNTINDEDLKSFKVLIVDDDNTTRIFLGATISQWGYEIIEASNGNEAWKLLQKQDDLRLIILDWLMPKMDGIELCNLIRQKLHYQPYIILLTQHTGTQNIIDGLEAGANEFLGKPFNINELRSRMASGARIIKYEALLLEQNEKLKQMSNLKNCETLIKDTVKLLAELMSYADDHKKIIKLMPKIKELQINLQKWLD